MAANDPNVLSGTGQAALNQRHAIRLIRADTARVYWLDDRQREVRDARNGATLAATVLGDTINCKAESTLMTSL